MHIAELRTTLAAVYTAATRTPPTYSHPTLDAGSDSHHRGGHHGAAGRRGRNLVGVRPAAARIAARRFSRRLTEVSPGRGAPLDSLSTRPMTEGSIAVAHANGDVASFTAAQRVLHRDCMVVVERGYGVREVGTVILRIRGVAKRLSVGWLLQSQACQRTSRACSRGRVCGLVAHGRHETQCASVAGLEET